MVFSNFSSITCIGNILTKQLTLFTGKSLLPFTYKKSRWPEQFLLFLLQRCKPLPQAHTKPRSPVSRQDAAPRNALLLAELGLWFIKVLWGEGNLAEYPRHLTALTENLLGSQYVSSVNYCPDTGNHHLPDECTVTQPHLQISFLKTSLVYHNTNIILC